MLLGKARWEIGLADDALASSLAEEMSVSLLVAKLLVQRGIQSADEAKRFLYEGIEGFHDPFLLDGMQAAVERIKQAIESGERILVYGDYDADGVTSTALMSWLLRGLGANFDCYIPHRVREGYGLNCEAIKLAHEQGVSLIVTVDTGVSAVAEIAYIQELGMDVIVTDHHEPPAVLPEPLALINPKKPTCPYPFKGLAGVGVAFKLAHALLGRVPQELLQYAAIGTVADLMPLKGENRILVKLGLEQMRTTTSPGLNSLLQVCRVEKKDVSAGHIGFGIGPRLNASGRLESADAAVKLLTTEDADEATQLADTLDALNIERQQIVEDLTELAVAQVEAMRIQTQGDIAEELPRVLVLAGEDWNVGVVGIVASRIVERYYRPTIVLSINPEKGSAKGSARSIAGFDMYEALTSCASLFDHFGGHAAAAGMSLSAELIEELRSQLNVFAAERLTPEQLIPQLTADIACSLADVPLACIEELALLAPYGMGNPTPKFVFKELQITDIRTMGKESQHLKLALTQAQEEISCAIEGVAFSKGSLSPWMTVGASVEALAELSVNEWNGVRKPQLLLRDVKIPHLQLFDWRGASRAQEKLAALVAAANAAPPEAGAVLGVLLFADGNSSSARLSAPAAEAAHIGIPAWQLHAGTGTVTPANEHAELRAFHSVTDVVFYNLPRHIDQLRQAVVQCTGMQRVYPLFADLDPLSSSVMPSRDEFKGLYSALRSLGQWRLSTEHARVCHELARRLNLSNQTVSFMLTVFEELQFLERDETMLRVAASPSKRDLSESITYQARLHYAEVEQTCIYTSAKQLEQWMRNIQVQMAP